MSDKEMRREASGLARLQAKELEEVFISRFEKNFKEFRGFGQIHHPLENHYYSANASSKEALHTNKYRRVIEVMKRNKVFDRSVLEDMPFNEVSHFEISTRRFFGRKVLKIVVAAMCLSPLEDLIVCRPARKLGLVDLEAAIQHLVRESDVFYYIGVASISGWEGPVLDQIPKGVNWLAGIVEPVDSSYWKLRFPQRESWNGMDQVYDPEMDSEKIARAKKFLLAHRSLRLKGGHILLDDLYREMEVPDYIFVQVLEEIIQENPDLEVKDVSDKKILRKKRL